MKAGSAIGEFFIAIGVTAITRIISIIHSTNNTHELVINIVAIFSANRLKVRNATTALTATPIPTKA